VLLAAVGGGEARASPEEKVEGSSPACRGKKLVGLNPKLEEDGLNLPLL